MKTLNRYISINVISSILIVLSVVVSLLIFVNFSEEFSDIGTGNYNLLHAMVYVFMTLPAGIYQFFPMAGLLGCLIGLGLLASRSELIVMRAAGVSIVQITGVVLKTACLIIVLTVLLGELAAPWLQRDATVYKAAAISQGQAFHTDHGIWLRQGDDFISIEALLPGYKLKNITRYQFDDNKKLISTTLAKQGSYQHGKWIFQDVTTSQFNKGRINNIHYNQQQWDLKLKPHLLGIMKIDSGERSIPQLYSYIKYLHYSGLRANKYEFLFWQRVFQPLATLVMILLAIPFIFGPLRTVPMGLRIIAGAVTGLGFYIINQFTGPIAVVYQLSPLVVAIMPTLLVTALGIVLLLRAK